MSESGTSTRELLAQLEDDTTKRVAAIEDRAAHAMDLETAFADIQQKFEEAEKIDDDRERAQWVGGEPAHV